MNTKWHGLTDDDAERALKELAAKSNSLEEMFVLFKKELEVDRNDIRDLVILDERDKLFGLGVPLANGSFVSFVIYSPQAGYEDENGQLHFPFLVI